MEAGFCGPLFIIGMPRSGTKLMRALLNQHPRINLTLAESHFIPYFLKKFGNPPMFRTREDLNPFVRELQQTAFFATMKKAGYSLGDSTLFKDIDYSSWSKIFEHLFRRFGPKEPTSDTIWGDKTPGYINHMPLLKTLFPGAKFLHMLRDPRDYCLSVRKSFGKSIYRAAHRWRQGVENAHRYGACLNEDYKEVRYEFLLDQPVSAMKSVASFLAVPYDDKLVDLSSSQEDLGDAKGRSGILTGNRNKYRTQLTSQEIKRIEEMVCNIARSVDYRLETNVPLRSLNSVTLGILKVHDGVASLRHHMLAERGFTRGARRLFNHYTRSSWRAVAMVGGVFPVTGGSV
jgi:Sulfotransferase family